MSKITLPARAGQLGSRVRKRAILLATAASMLGALSGTAHAEGDTLRLLTYNIWNRFKQQPEAPAQFLIPGNYDAVMFQEESGSRYVTDLPGILGNAGLGTYQGARNGSSGIISRLPGTVGTYRLPGVTSQGRDITYSVAEGADGRPTTTIGSVHFDYGDGSTNRIREAKALSQWATQVNGPLIMGGDFNSGDVAERGLHNVDAQIRLIRNVGSNSLYRTLAYEYIANGDEAQMRKAIQEEFPGQNIDNLSWTQWGNALAAAVGKGKDVGLKDETYPVANNTPVTMNILKKQFVMMQTDAIREQFAPHERGDGSTTWPSYGEDATNTWASWDRAKIDHFLISRPYAKWYAITDNPDDEYLGVVDKIYVTGSNGSTAPLTDHDLVAHEFTWVGPQLETYATDEGDQTRLVWGEDASSFDKNDKVFNLTRNNMRTDVYLGQVSDENGNPILGWLTEEEKKTLLDCTSTDGRLAGAIAEYCIDDHSFIAETLVKDSGTLAVTEDAALGNASADLRLTGDAGLRIDGTAMDTLARDISLEGEGGFIEVAEAAADVNATGTVSGEGALAKRGEGTLRLSGQNTYTGNTDVEAGTLLVEGSIASSALTTVSAGATLGGNGTIGNLVVNPSGTITPGAFGIGSLTVDGDLTMNGGLFDLEIGSTGFDTIKVTGDFFTTSAFKLSFSFLDGVLPGEDAVYEFLTVDGAVAETFFDLVTLILPEGDAFLGLSLFNSDGRFSLAWADPYAVAPVPLPAPALMLFSALGLMGAIRARRKKTV